MRGTVFDSLSSALAEALGDEAGNWVLLASVGSTNVLGRRLAQEYLKEGSRVPRTVLVAVEQTAGRGRQGNTWHSPAGEGIYATVVLPLSTLEGVERLPLVAGVALCEAVNRILPGAPCRLKWPNDLMVGGRKLGGLLIEVVAGEEGPGAVLIGFGVNYSREGDQRLGAAPGLPGATTVAEHAAATLALGEVAAALVGAVLDAVASPDARVAVRYAELSAHRPGDAIGFRSGEERIAGTFRGFDERGFLRLEQAGRERLFSSGEVIEP